MIANQLKGSTILITGASGFIGRQFCSQANLSKIKVSALVSPESQVDLDNHNIFRVKLSDRKKLLEIVEKISPDYIVHLAFNKSRGFDPRKTSLIMAENASLSNNLIDAAQLVNNLKGFVFLGSCDEYGAANPPFNELTREIPSNSYGLSKLVTTHLLLGLYREMGFPATILRPSIVYGPKQGLDMFIPTLISNLLQFSTFKMTSGNQYRDFVYIDDVVEAIFLALVNITKVQGNIINIANGKSYKLKKIAELTLNKLGSDKERNIQFGALAYRNNESFDYAVDIQKANELLNWKPKTSLARGIAKTVSYYREVVT